MAPEVKEKQQELDDLFAAVQFHEGDMRVNYNGKLQIYLQGKWRGTDEMV
jgi:hypothetical protein